MACGPFRLPQAPWDAGKERRHPRCCWGLHPGGRGGGRDGSFRGKSPCDLLHAVDAKSDPGPARVCSPLPGSHPEAGVLK